MFTNQTRHTSQLVTTSIWSLVIFSMVATGASPAFAQDCVRDPAWLCDGDVDADGQVNPVDVGLVMAAFGGTADWQLCQYDMDCDGTINPVDAGIVQSLYDTCEEPRAVCGGEEPSLDDLIFFEDEDDVVELVVWDDAVSFAGIVVGQSNRAHIIHWSTNNENVSVEPQESEVYFEERGDVFVLSFTVHSGQDEAFTLTGEVVGPDWEGAVQQEVGLFKEGDVECAIKYTKTVTDKNGNEVSSTNGTAKDNPVKKEEVTGTLIGSIVEKDSERQMTYEISAVGGGTIKTVYRCDEDECDGNGFPCAGAVVIDDPDNDGNDNGTLYCECPGG